MLRSWAMESRIRRVSAFIILVLGTGFARRSLSCRNELSKWNVSRDRWSSSPVAASTTPRPSAAIRTHEASHASQ